MALVTAVQVETLLGRPLTAAELAALPDAEALILAQVVAISGPLEFVAGDTVIVRPCDCVHTISLAGPISDVTSVTINGEPAEGWTWNPCGLRLPCCVCHGDAVEVVYDHGYPSDHPKMVALAALLARMLASQFRSMAALAAAGAAGVLTSETVGSYSYEVSDESAPDVDPRTFGALTDADVAWVRRMFRRTVGTIPLR